MNREDEEKSCAAYFQDSPIWNRVLEGFMKKYGSYGSFSGTVKLGNLTRQDRETLEGFFGRSFHGQKSVSVSAEKFRKALADSRYHCVTPERLLELYFHKKPVGRRQAEEEREKQRLSVMQEAAVHFQKTPAADVLSKLRQIIKGKETAGTAEWKDSLYMAAEMFNSFPYRRGKTMYLAVFAAEMTGNPHAFDVGTAGGELLKQLCELDLRQRKITVNDSRGFSAYKRQRSLLSVGILIDHVSNYAMLCGVRVRKKDGTMHKGMEGFLEESDMVQVPLAAMADWEEILCPKERLYVVENPSVFAALCESGKDGYALMCMNGQPRLAGLLVLELCARSKTTVYYAGDLDPEGVLIAEKLSHFYVGEFHYWHMTPKDYEICRSAERITERRIKMLERITDERLQPVVNRIKEQKTSGYQEKLLLANNPFF